MKCICWNVRGLRDDRRRGIVGRYLRAWGADIICLQETWLTQVEQRTWTSFGWGSDLAHVAIEATGRSGGILLAWKEEFFDLLSTWKGRHVAAAQLKHRKDGTCIVVASAYGPSISGRREELWEDLRQLHGTFDSAPMLIGGDFNVTLWPDDRPDGGGGRDPGSSQFREVLALLGLADMGPQDRRYTWNGPASQSRLDRFLCSTELLALCPLAEVSALPRPLSDHTPILWSAKVGEVNPTYFKMDRSWFRDDKFKEDLCAWWRSRQSQGPVADSLVDKLKDLRHHLRGLRSQIRAARTQDRDAALSRVQALDEIEDTRPLTSDELVERKVHQSKVAEADLRIEMDWRQRSRQLWLSAGDANTRFFHQAANGRRRQNCVRKLRIGDNMFSDPLAIGQAVADHFRAFYRRGPPNQWRWLATGASTISTAQQHELTLPFSEDEVKQAIRGLNAEGAPGPDGIPVFLYLECWDAIGAEVMATVEDFRAGRCNMDRLNRAYIILLPKVEGAEHIGDFRSISLSNSIYLIIAKVLANRLRSALRDIINPFQSAFLPGRQMSEGIVLAEEIVAAWRRDRTPGFLWKVDFSKAYDSLDWRFLWNVLRRRGFPETWVRWVKQCVTTTTFAVLVNGRPQGGWIHPQRGIRQGCPLAPLLFILAADALAVCTGQLCSKGHIVGFQSSSVPGGIPLLQYADDTTFFIQGSWAAAHTLSIMMDIFSDFSGLHLNRAKSAFIGFGLSPEEVAGCSRILATPTAELPM